LRKHVGLTSPLNPTPDQPTAASAMSALLFPVEVKLSCRPAAMQHFGNVMAEGVVNDGAPPGVPVS
jgi:hypothetical protein